MTTRFYIGDSVEMRMNGKVVPLKSLTVSDSEPERVAGEDFEFLPPPAPSMAELLQEVMNQISQPFVDVFEKFCLMREEATPRSFVRVSKRDLASSNQAILVDKNLIPVDINTWARWFSLPDNGRKIARTEMNEGIVISTVFIGLNRRVRPNDSPGWFETMAFDANGKEAWCEYSETYEEAEQTHKRVLKRFARIERNAKEEKRNRTVGRGVR